MATWEAPCAHYISCHHTFNNGSVTKIASACRRVVDRFCADHFQQVPKALHKHMRWRRKFIQRLPELRVVFKDILTRKQLRRYLGSYFMYNMGVQTVMIMAVPFATKAIEWKRRSRKTKVSSSAFSWSSFSYPRCISLSRLSRVIGNLKTIGIVSSSGYDCFCVFKFVYTPVQFYMSLQASGWWWADTSHVAIYVFKNASWNKWSRVVFSASLM